MAQLRGITNWEASVDSDGHRDYKVVWLAKAVNAFEGPRSILAVPGLPVVGSPWGFAGSNFAISEVDPWAICHPTAKVKPLLTKEPNLFWEIEQLFSTRPISESGLLNDKNPLLLSLIHI